MTDAKSKTKAPGRNVEEWERGTYQLRIRCSEELAARARKAATERGRTLADVLEAGCEAMERG